MLVVDFVFAFGFDCYFYFYDLGYEYFLVVVMMVCLNHCDYCINEDWKIVELQELDEQIERLRLLVLLLMLDLFYYLLENLKIVLFVVDYRSCGTYGFDKTKRNQNESECFPIHIE